MDGCYAQIRCGRRWKTSRGSTYFSGPYPVLAQRFGFELARLYSLDGPVVSEQSLYAMHDELKTSLTAVSRRVTVCDLEAIELDEFGAVSWIHREFRKLPRQTIEVSPFVADNG